MADLPAFDAPSRGEQPFNPKIEKLTIDGWLSELTGMGILGKDKNESTIFHRRGRRHHDELDALYRQDPLAARIVDVIVDDALRQGYHIVFKGDDENAVDPETVNDINSRVNVWKKAVGLTTHVKNHLKQARTYGGSVLVMGANDGQDPIQPINPDTVSEFTFVKPLDRFQLSASGLLNTDPRSQGFGFPAWYHLNSVFGSFELVTSALLDEQLARKVGVISQPQVEPGGGASGSEIIAAGTGQVLSEGGPTLNNVTVHTSRVVRTDGTLLSDRSRLNNDGWGDSILERVYEPLRNWNTVMNAAGTLVHDMNQGVYGIKGLAGILAANAEGLVRKRMQLQELAASLWNAKLLDADGETYERLRTDFSDLPNLIDRFGVHLGAAAGMPVTLILEISPGGFGTGENENNQWDDVVVAYQDEDVRPVLEAVFQMLFLTPEFSDVPDSWAVEFFPLKQMSEADVADIHLKQAQADATNIASSVLSPQEVAHSRFGGEKFSLETQLDEEARQGMKPAETDEEKAAEEEAAKLNAEAEGDPDAEPTDPDAPPEGEVPPEGETPADPAEPAANGEPESTDEDAADPRTAFAGGQTAALTTIIVQVMNNELPFESAVQLVAMAFPVNEADARRLLQPAVLMQAQMAAEKEAKRAAMDPAMQAEMDKPGPGNTAGGNGEEGGESEEGGDNPENNPGDNPNGPTPPGEQQEPPG